MITMYSSVQRGQQTRVRTGHSQNGCRQVKIKIETLTCTFSLSLYYKKYFSKEKYLFVDQLLLIKIYSRHSAKLTPIFREKFQSPTHMMIQKPSILTVPCSHPRLLPALDFAPPPYSPVFLFVQI